MSDMDRYLDGELAPDEVAEARRAEAQSWDRLLEAFRAESPVAPAPAWLESRVMAEIESLPESGILTRVWRWMTRPTTLTIRPAVAGVAAVALAALLLIPRGPSSDMRPPAPSMQAASLVYVQFTLRAPEAGAVAVGGDFDAWAGAYALEDPDGDGVWSGRVPLPAGVHNYMFLVDGDEWVTDPGAVRYHDDGFGNRNAVLAVTLPSA